MSTKDLRKAYHPNYFSIDSILAAQTLVPCMTQTTIPKFGFLVPDCNSEDLPFGTNLQLPIWAARVLCRPLRTFVAVTIPPGFKEAHGKVTEEDPNIVDLSKVNDNFYEAGHLCTALFHSEAGELAEMLPDVLQARVLCLGSATGTPSPNGTPIKAELMDNVEKKLMEDTQKCRTNVDEWLE
ncbi:DNA replication complex GINS protein PSF3, partial [Orchesella cincta]